MNVHYIANLIIKQFHFADNFRVCECFIGGSEQKKKSSGKKAKGGLSVQKKPKCNQKKKKGRKKGSSDDDDSDEDDEDDDYSGSDGYGACASSNCLNPPGPLTFLFNCYS